MQIELIEFEFGLTQNVGDYSNVRPSLKLVARLAEDDDYNEAIGELTRQAIDNVRNIVDDELELAGRRVKYTFEQLFTVRYSDVRQCVIVFPTGTELPEERTWRDRDYWQRPGVDRDYPDKMRIQLAQVIAILVGRQSNLELIYCTDGDLSHIPPLPDPGPEPLWHQKNLEQDLKALHIDKELWEELAALDWVTSQYMTELRRQLWSKNLSVPEIVALIRAGGTLAVEADEPEDDDYEEEDYDDEEDDDFDDD